MGSITIADDNEFTVLIADFIETLAGTVQFSLKIWISGSEIPFAFNHRDNFHFMQEGFRVSSENLIEWFFYDNIVSMRLYYES